MRDRGASASSADCSTDEDIAHLDVCNKQSTSDLSSSENEPESTRRNATESKYQLTKQESIILKDKYVRDQVSKSLKRGLSFQFDETTDDVVLIKPAGQTNLDTFKGVLLKELLTVQVDFQETDRDVIRSFNVAKLQQRMVMDFDEKQKQLTIVYHKSIHKRLEKGLRKLRTHSKKIPLLSMKTTQYLKQYDEWFLDSLRKTFSVAHPLKPNVLMKLKDMNAEKTSLLVECDDRVQSPAVFSITEELLTNLGINETEVSLDLGLYLQSLEGQRKLQEISQKYHCLCFVVTPTERVIFSATRCQHQVSICQGLITASEAEVMVLPICEGQTDWPPLHKQVLDKEFMSTAVDKYLSNVGPPPKSYIQSHTRQHSNAGVKKNQQTLVMFVPTLQNSKNQEEFSSSLQASCRAAMHSALETKSSTTEIACPFKLSDNIDLKTSALVLLTAVIKIIREKSIPKVSVKLFLDVLPSDVDTVLADLENLFTIHGWCTDAFIVEPASKSLSVPTFQSKGTGVVHLFGLKDDASQAAAEIADIQVPSNCTETYRKKAVILEALDSVMTLARQTQTSTGMKVLKTTAVAVSTQTEQTEVAMDHDCCLMVLPEKVTLEAFNKDPDIAYLIKNCASVQCRTKRGELFRSKQFVGKTSDLTELTQIRHAVTHSSDHEQPLARVYLNKGGADPLTPVEGHFAPEQKTKWKRQLPHPDFIALTCLIGSEFKQMFFVSHGTGDLVEIQSDAPPPQETITKFDNLRKEEMQLLADEAQMLGEPFDTRKEGVDAFILPVPAERKVILYSFDYNNLPKAKHLVNVKLGKIKVNSRSKRNLDGVKTDSVSSLVDQSPSGGVDSGSVMFEYSTKSGMKVSVYKADITKLHVDAIVTAANERLMHVGGVAHAIAEAAGWQLEDEGQEYIQQNSPLKVAEVISTTAGNLPCKNVLHAVGPKWDTYADKQLCKVHLVLTIYNCLIKANDLGFVTLAVPPISSAIFGVPQEICAECYVAGVQKFEAIYGGKTSLSHVHFVDVNDVMVKIVQDAFSQKWDTHLSLANEISVNQQEPTTGSLVRGKEAPSSSRPPNLSQESRCPICLDIMVDRFCLHICKHWFCKGCIDQSLKVKPVCPLCQTVYGVITGDQPQDGKMKMYRGQFSLPGYPTDDTLIVTYSFPDGLQHNEHPQPGKLYDGIERAAYLPNNRDGRKVLMLLKIAFDRRLIFTIEQSHTTGSDGIVWNDIHHKTRQKDASYGYPDHKYLTRVQAELASKGVRDDDLTDTQKDFIQHPERYFPGFLGNAFSTGDFSYKFK